MILNVSSYCGLSIIRVLSSGSDKSTSAFNSPKRRVNSLESLGFIPLDFAIKTALAEI